MKLLRELRKRQTCASVLAEILRKPLTSVIDSLKKVEKAGFARGSKWGRDRVYTITDPVSEIVSRSFGDEAQRVLQNALRMQRHDPEMDKEMALVKSVCSSGFPLVAGQPLETLVTSHVFPNGLAIERVPGATYRMLAFLPTSGFTLAQFIGRGPYMVARGPTERMWKASQKEVVIWLRERMHHQL